MEKITVKQEADNIFEAVGLDASDASIENFSSRASKIGQKIGDALTGQSEEEYSRSAAIAEIQDNFSYPEILLMAFHHIEDRVQDAIHEQQMRQIFQSMPKEKIEELKAAVTSGEGE